MVLMSRAIRPVSSGFVAIHSCNLLEPIHRPLALKGLICFCLYKSVLKLNTRLFCPPLLPPHLFLHDKLKYSLHNICPCFIKIERTRKKSLSLIVFYYEIGYGQRNEKDGFTFLNPISCAYSLKHCRQRFSPYFLISPWPLAQARLKQTQQN